MDTTSNGDLRLEINADKDIAISSALGAAVSTKIKEGKTAKSTNIEFVSKKWGYFNRWRYCWFGK